MLLDWMQVYRKTPRKLPDALRDWVMKVCGRGKKNVNPLAIKRKYIAKYRIYDVICEALRTCRSMEALKAALAARGIGMNIVCNTKGLVFTCDGISFTGYRINRSMSCAKLC